MYYFPPPCRRVMKAFTFAEFLVVAVIFLGIAVIIFPTGGRSRENARRSSCQSNLKQIGLAVAQYMQDSNERYPMWQQGSDPARGWAASVQPYLKNVAIYQCRSETTSAEIEPSSSSYSDYFYNSNLGPRTGGHRREQLANAALTIMVGDAASFSSNNASSGGTVTTAGIDGRSEGKAVAQGQWVPGEADMRHMEGSNFGFADGHVKWLRPGIVTRDAVANQPTFRWSDRNPPVSGS